MDSKQTNINFLKFTWACSICWFLLTGHQWTLLLTDANFKLIYLSELILFISSISFLLTFSNKVFILTLSAQLLEWFILLPNAPNHRWIFAFAAVIFLFFLKSEDTLKTEKSALRLSKSFGLLLIILYFFAGFAKLNVDFLFEKHSCSTTFLSNVLFLNKLPQALIAILPTLVSVTEIALVALIIQPKTRILASALALTLHLGLALDMVKHFLDFSSVMSCLIIATILPTSTNLVHVNKLKKWGKLLAIILVTLVIIRSNAAFNIKLSDFSLILEIYWLFYYSLLLGCFYKIIRINDIRWSIGDKNQLNYVIIFILLLAIFNGLCPYLGLKTRSSFSMYSNLWIDDSGSNHLLIPKSLDLFGFLKDDVKIISTNDNAGLSILKNENLSIPYIQLYSFLKSEPLIKVDYLRAEKSYSYPNDELTSPNQIFDNWLARKFLIFQGSNPVVAEKCIW